MRLSVIRLGAGNVISALTFSVMTCPETEAAAAFTVVYGEDSMVVSLERMGGDQLVGTLLLLGLLVGLIMFGFRCLRAIASAAKQSRAYESRALTALYFNRVDEAINAADSFPRSPVARVVGASFLSSSTYSRAGVDLCKPNKAAFNRALIAQTHGLKRGLWVMAAIGWSSAMVGLITALGPSSIHSSGPPFPLLLGLGIAVPAIWLYKGLSSQADWLLFETDRMSSSIVDQIGEQLAGAFDNQDTLVHHKPREIRFPIPSQHSRPLRRH